MSLLLTRNVDQYCIDIRGSLAGSVGIHRLDAPFLEPFTDEVTVKTITLDDQHALHGPLR